MAYPMIARAMRLKRLPCLVMQELPPPALALASWWSELYPERKPSPSRSGGMHDVVGDRAFPVLPSGIRVSPNRTIASEGDRASRTSTRYAWTAHSHAAMFAAALTARRIGLLPGARCLNDGAYPYSTYVEYDVQSLPLSSAGHRCLQSPNRQGFLNSPAGRPSAHSFNPRSSSIEN